MSQYVGKIWVNGIGPVRVFLDAKNEAEACDIVHAKAAEMTRNPVPGVQVKTRIIVAAAEG